MCDMNLETLMDPTCVNMNLETLMNELLCYQKCFRLVFHINGMKLNLSKCKVLVYGHKLENMICNIENAQVIETHMVKLFRYTN